MMRIRTEWVLITAIAAVFAGCGHKKDAASELDKAAAAMAKFEAPQPVATPLPAAPNQPASSPEPAAAPAVPPPAQQMQQAVAAYKAGQLEDAVTRLQLLRMTPVLTPDQRMVLQDSIAAVMTEIYTMAEKGDTRAIAAVMQYEKMQTAPR